MCRKARMADSGASKVGMPAVLSRSRCPRRTAVRPSSRPAPACPAAARTAGSWSGRLGRVGHGLRRQQDQDALNVRVLAADFDSKPVASRRGIAQKVDRVGVAPERRQSGVEGGQRFLPERCQLTAGEHQSIGGHDAGAAGVGDDGQAGPRGGGCMARISDMLNRSGMVSTRSTPARRKAASKTASAPASAPVCEAAARPPPHAGPPSPR